MDVLQQIGWAQPWHAKLTSVTWPDGLARTLDESTSPFVSVYYHEPGTDYFPYLGTTIHPVIGWNGSQLDVSPLPIGNVPDLPATTNGFDVTGISLRHVSLVGADPVAVSTRLELAAPFPNPAVLTTAIRWSMPAAGDATLEIYDVSGRRVAELQNGKATAGSHTTSWNLTDASGARVSPGIYFARFASGAEERSTRLVVVNR